MNSITQWLHAIGLGQYVQQFIDNRIDLDVVPDLSDSDLKELGLALGDRKRFLHAVAQLHTSDSRSEQAPLIAASVSNSERERRQLTIVFCDLVGSTALSSRLDPEALGLVIQGYRKSVTEVVARYEGHVAQYLGDGLMLYFGWPRAHEDDALRAVMAALDVLAALRADRSPERLHARVGIATGTVIVGQSSEDAHGEGGLAVGETPNLAARLQAEAGADEIIIAGSTQRLIGNAFLLDDIGERALKGVQQKIQAFKVKGVRRVEGRFEASRGQRVTQLVGRESELALLADRWHRAMSGEGQVVMLSAEAGVGKSRVVLALRERIADTQHVEMLFQSSALHSNSAFHPIIEQFERAAQFQAEDSPEDKLVRMEAVLASIQGDFHRVAPLYAAMLSLPVTRYASDGLSAQQLRERTVAVQVERIAALSRKQPVLMVLEDAHWADPSTLEVFGALIAQIETLPVLLLITYRPEFVLPWKDRGRSMALTLTRLSRGEIARLAERVAGKRLPVEVLEQIMAKTDCVPLYVEEFTKAIVELGFMKDEGERYSIAGPLPPLAIPSTLQDSLMARLDRHAPVKELIQLGAVIGREFGRGALSVLSQWSDRQLDNALDRLVESELVFKRGNEAESVFVFKHALVQDAAYESILKSQRQSLHARLASTLESDGRFAQTHPEVLAQHFERAGVLDKAMDWYTRAGELANRRSAGSEALHHFQRALALLDQSGSVASGLRVTLNTEIALLHMVHEGWASHRALEHFIEAERSSRDMLGSEERFRTVVGMITTLTWCGRRSEASAQTQELLDLARASGERLHRLYAHQLHGQSLMFEGRFRAALTAFQLATSYYAEENDAGLASRYGHDAGQVSLWYTAYMLWDTGSFDQAFDTSERAMALSRRIGHPFSLSRSLAWMLDLSAFMGLPERILNLGDEAIEIARRYNFAHGGAMCQFHQGWALARKGDLERGVDQMTRALDPTGPLGVGAVITSRLRAQLADAYAHAGMAEEGLRVLNESPDRKSGQQKVRHPEISRVEGDLHLLKSEPDPVMAERLYREAIDIAITDENKSKHLKAAVSLAKLLRSQEKLAEAIAVLKPLYESFTEGFEFPDMKDARLLLEQLQGL